MRQAAQNAHPALGKKRRQESSPQLQHNRAAFLQQEDFVATGLRRASTFPETMPDQKRTAGSALPISQAHLASLGIDPGYSRSPSQSTSDFYDSLPNLTPTSTTTSVGSFGVPANHPLQHRPSHSFPATPLGNSFIDPTGMNVPLSDVNAMMFPSTDPFAYPNQPMTTFENNHAQDFKTEMSPTAPNMPYQVPREMKTPVAFNPAGANVPVGSRRLNDNDVQLFGPMPMYLMQGAQQQINVQPRTAPQNLQMTGAPSTGNMNFTDLLGGEEWANTFMDQSLGLSGARPGYGNNPHYGSAGGPGPQPWR